MLNHSTPAIVAQSAVRRLPRAVLLLLGLVYTLAGFVGREPWKSADMASFGFMAELAQTHAAGAATAAQWLDPRLLGLTPEVDALLPYWLGAFALRIAPAWIAPDLAARIPFMLMLAATLAATWFGVYYLARGRLAQPVAFAFGGEARPADYARAVADGGLLALLATLGLAQLSHEVTPAAAQLCFTALFFYAAAALPYRRALPTGAALVGLLGLTLSGAPTIALLLGVGASLLEWTLDEERTDGADGQARPHPGGHRRAVGLLLLTLIAASIATALDLWRWRIALPAGEGDWRAIGRLLLWFAWPTWLLALWTVWRWRHQLVGPGFGRHLGLPLWFTLVALATMIATASSSRSLLLALPALAALAAFALPTLKRSMAALIDWFTLLFFSGCAVLIWFMWIAMQTGVPPRPAANVARLVPGFDPQIDPGLFALALAATLTWGWLVKWRVGRHRAAIWKSVVLPAGGAVLCWLLLTTLWLPVFDYARSYGALVRRIATVVGRPACVEVFGLTRAQIAAFRFHGRFELQPAGGFASCAWMIVDADALAQLDSAVDLGHWDLYGRFRRPGDNNEDVLVYRRVAGAPADAVAPPRMR